MRRLCRWLGRATMLMLAGAITMIGLTVGLSVWINGSYAERIYSSASEVPARRVAVVFGAGVWPGGQLSDVLADRVATAAALYKAGKVEKLLMTGDNRFVHYNEPQHMKEYVMALGVPEGAIVLDYAGRRTYDSCYRAREIFEVPNAILVTQRFHLPRALFTCNRLGVDAIGVAADRRRYLYEVKYRWREVPANLVAWWQVEITRPRPILGDKLPIFPDEATLSTP